MKEIQMDTTTIVSTKSRNTESPAEHASSSPVNDDNTLLLQ